MTRRSTPGAMKSGWWWRGVSWRPAWMQPGCTCRGRRRSTALEHLPGCAVQGGVCADDTCVCVTKWAAGRVAEVHDHELRPID
eukprot:53275-Eustigmatos_ZCMA.PRE.1